MCTEVASASGDPHASTINSDSFDLWRTGWSTFVQVHLASVGPGCWCEVMFDRTEVQHVLLHFASSTDQWKLVGKPQHLRAQCFAGEFESFTYTGSDDPSAFCAILIQRR